jgi:hypothetical protein
MYGVSDIHPYKLLKNLCNLAPHYSLIKRGVRIVVFNATFNSISIISWRYLRRGFFEDFRINYARHKFDNKNSPKS